MCGGLMRYIEVLSIQTQPNTNEFGKPILQEQMTPAYPSHNLLQKVLRNQREILRQECGFRFSQHASTPINKWMPNLLAGVRLGLFLSHVPSLPKQPFVWSLSPDAVPVS